MGIWDQFGGTNQQTDNIEETQVKKTVVKDGEQIRGLGGSSVREVKNGSQMVSEETIGLVFADDGQITTTDPRDQRYPHLAGKDYRGNLVSKGNFFRCMEKGCNRMVSNLSGVEYEPGLWRCTKHYKRYDLRQFFKNLLWFFYRPEEKVTIPEKPKFMQGDMQWPPKDQDKMTPRF